MQLRNLPFAAALWLACAVVGQGEPEGKPLPENGRMTLTLPPALKAPAAVVLRVTVGALPKGARIVVRSKDGRELGAITPFGQSTNQPGVFYTIPVPTEAVADGRLSVDLALEERGKERRAPTDTEVRAVQLEGKP